MTIKNIIFSVIGLIAISLLIWFVGPLISIGGKAFLDGEVARLVAILIVVLLWALNLVRKAFAAKSANAQIAEGIAGGEPAPRKSRAADGPDRSLEQRAVLGERFQEAIEVLKKTGKKGAGNLYELPWYIIIGPPGAGKTTALKNSGLKFPLADRFGTEALRGVGGTRDCDWWFTDEAILLDTAGRYVTQDSDKEVDATAWQTFLKLLKRYRKRRPINGVFVAISLADVLTQSDRERQLHVRAIKQRVLELYSTLGLRFPVYLMFTKCDLVAGFMEFYDDLGREEREQVWGCTFDLEEPDAPGALAREYELLLERLNERLLSRLNDERDPQRRGLIYGFPQQMSTIRAPIQSFVEEVFRATRFDQSILLRGVYFTSGTQEGTPIDRVMGAVARSFGLSAQRIGALSGSGRSYFLANLLQKVVFPEADIAGLNRRSERARVWLRRFGYFVALGALAAGIAAWSAAYTRNTGYVQKVDEKTEAWNKIAPQPIDVNTPIEEVLKRFDTLRDITTVYDEYEANHARAWELGMYQGGKLGGAAKAAYHRELNRVFVPMLVTRIATQIQRVGRDTDPKYAALKAYLMLGDAKHLEPDFLKAWLQLHWEMDYPRAPDTVKGLLSHLDALLTGGMQAAELDEKLVAETRLALNQTPLAELVYARLKRDALRKTDTPPLVLSEVVGPLGAKAFARRSGKDLGEAIPHFFTYDGYYQDFQPEIKLLAARARSESWVLANDRDELTAAELTKLDGDVTQLYFSDYLKVWQGLVGDLKIVQFRSVPQALEVLEALSGRNSALRALLVTIDKNTSLTRLPGGLDAAAGKLSEKVQRTKDELAKMIGVADKPAADQPAVPGAAVEDHFVQLNSAVKPDKNGVAPIDVTIEALAKLYSELDAMSSAPPTPDAPKQQESLVNKRLKEIAIGQPDPLKDWIMQLTSGAADVAGRQQQAEQQKKISEDTKTLRTAINEAWSSDVLPFCKKAVQGRYPLNPATDAEATLRDFGKLFAPGGLIDGFVKDKLKRFIDNTAEPWKWRTVEDISVGSSEQALMQLQTAAKIRDAYFGAGGDVPALEFAVKAVNIDVKSKAVVLDVGGQQLVFGQNQPNFQNVKWPSPAGGLDAAITFQEWSGRTTSRRKDGPWALFRLLEQAKLERVTADRGVATFRFDDHYVQFEIRATSVVNPLLVDEAHSFTCPEKF
ncbi:MAG: type VI secretion system membrane subunit TssM [Gammaproteobacteria bacterium]|nr:type VI secretion system membrane subunit TssM [Gammaproteobacteria bacterium]MBI5615193.1 type VI secretion system membrane subunit TssM [Gammaproteobacteria bacterium]